jgi:hypothetical protein
VVFEEIYGSRKWPNFEELSAELMTYAIAMKGVNDLKNESGGALVMGNQGTVKDEAFCYNCGRKSHRSICNDVNLLDNAKEKNGAAVQGITGHQLHATHSGEVGSIGLPIVYPGRRTTS